MRAFLLLLFLAFANYVQCLDLDLLYLLLNKEVSDNPECEAQKNDFLEGLRNNETWALKMLDASGRPPQAITQGNIIDAGTFDQCVDIQVDLNTGTMKGKYCCAGLAMPFSALNMRNLPLDMILNQSIPDDLSNLWRRRLIPSVEPRIPIGDKEIDINISDVMFISVCIPNGCSPSELFNGLGIDDFCQIKDENAIWDASDIACLTAIIITTILMIASTAYDLYLRNYSKEPSHKIFLAFSVYTNGSKIVSTQLAGQINFFSGFKVISMFWIILGHRYAGSEQYVINKEDVKNWRRNWYSVYVLSAHLAVDTFLFISGALLAYLFLKTMRKQKQKFNIFLYYLHRYLRLTPPLAVIYFVQITIVRRIASGPIYKYFFETERQKCVDNWWSFFLYIQNYTSRDRLCLIHTWYLSMDMHFFIISPLLLLPMVRYGKKITYMGVPFLAVLGTAYTMFLFNRYNIKLWTADYYMLYYYASHNRLAPWLIGTVFGAFMLDYQDNKIRFQIRNKSIVGVLWVLVSVTVAILMLSQDDVEYNHNRAKATFYFPLLRPAWTLCLCWISYACLSGNASFINTFLSLPIFQVLSRVTYSTYLVHNTLIMIHMGQWRTLPYFVEYDIIRIAIADIFVSYFAGAIWTLAFEAPVIVIERIFFASNADRRKDTITADVDKVTSNGFTTAAKNSV